ncbi:hypothetical protein PQ469_14200 [Mucilaginibacter sp. KACC 22773]|jgi:hypothetical protein|uniref:hypothetical protein n=1 Tax=Mucilaginibacter sp. KACC 22773 TaxID=3025671 RepID=UPI0023657F1E|nr:hypothetical protein [Mucilaginibacter sp. KACC 22773]WDF81159.1 hypothetical protein PQ469_14200 [Mucilaginibacter sp. KACC 22773]
MADQVLTADNRTVIADTDSDLRISVNDRKEVKIAEGTAYCLATLYRIKGGFISDKVYVFQAVEVDLVTLKNAVDFFFTTLLETELYVKQVPQDPALFPQEAARIYGTVILAA